jgi:hypothetical protein
MSGFYARLREKRKDDGLLQECIDRVVTELENSETSADRPGMLLGKIQSGKTRGFLGVIARAFDRDFDLAIVLTKGTKTLASQTVKRISGDFKEFIDDEEVIVFDIMEMPERLTRSELRRKIVIVAKKQHKNLDRVLKLIGETYRELSGRRILLVDDEADMASVRFVKKSKDEVSQGSIAQQMDDLRRLASRLAFLQVTATPYALYLQPDEYTPQPDQFVFYPKRPAFTELLPIHSGYVGGDEYFGMFDEGDYRRRLFVPVPEDEQNALRSGDGRSIREDRIWSTSNIAILRRAIMTFLTAVVIRRWQQNEQEQRRGKYAMIMHNDTQRAAHDWQWNTVERVRVAFEVAAAENDPRLRATFDAAYEDLHASVRAQGSRMPPADEVFASVRSLIADGELNVQRVNSDVQLAPLLDAETAELKLRAQANIFIGGSILDRGITVPSLIAFYYGRNPKRMQADTVLQHSRMYGARSHQDLAVTRFYTSQAVHDRLRQIHRLETTLREAFESGVGDKGVVFIQADSRQKIVPCAPSKISMSDVVAVRPNDFYFPSKFDTVDSAASRNATRQLELDIKTDWRNAHRFIDVSLDDALRFIHLSRPMIAVTESPDFQWIAMEGLLRYYAARVEDRVDLLVEINRDLGRPESGDKSGLSIVGGIEIRRLLRQTLRAKPALVLLRQNGQREKGWRADKPFWWPVLVAPSNAEACVFSATTGA